MGARPITDRAPGVIGEVLFVHAARVSLDATQRAFAGFDGPRIRHALDERLVDPRASGFTPGEREYERLFAFVSRECAASTSRVILSCSVYNGFAERLGTEMQVPVERSDDAGARAAAAYARLGLAVSYPPSYRLIEAHVKRFAPGPIEIIPLLRGNAFERAADARAYEQEIIDGARSHATVDAVFLAQYSMDPFRESVRRAARVPVISALERTRDRLAARADS